MYWASPIRLINSPFKPLIGLLASHRYNLLSRCFGPIQLTPHVLRLQLCCEMPMEMAQYSLMTDIFLKCNTPNIFQKYPQKVPWDCVAKHHFLVTVVSSIMPILY